MENQNEPKLKLLEPVPKYFGQPIRVLVDELNNMPWFVAIDICKAVDLAGTSGQHIRRLAGTFSSGLIDSTSAPVMRN